MGTREDLVQMWQAHVLQANGNTPDSRTPAMRLRSKSRPGAEAVKKLSR
jgi:hypothetical protein